MAMGNILPIAINYISRKGEKMNFNYEAYGKVFPETMPQATTIESAVDGYTPTADESQEKKTEELNTVTAPAEPQKQPNTAAQPQQGTNNPPEGTANLGQNSAPQEPNKPEDGGTGV